MHEGAQQWLMIGVGALVTWLVWEPWLAFANQVIPPGRYPFILLLAFGAVPPVLLGGLVWFLLNQIVDRIAFVVIGTRRHHRAVWALV